MISDKINPYDLPSIFMYDFLLIKTSLYFNVIQKCLSGFFFQGRRGAPLEFPDLYTVLVQEFLHRINPIQHVTLECTNLCNSVGFQCWRKSGKNSSIGQPNVLMSITSLKQQNNILLEFPSHNFFFFSNVYEVKELNTTNLYHHLFIIHVYMYIQTCTIMRFHWYTYCWLIQHWGHMWINAITALIELACKQNSNNASWYLHFL